jgi:uncharacterized protein YbcV (DUF1398 family)
VVRFSHTITLDADLRQSIQHYYEAVKDQGMTVPDVLRELLMRGLQIDQTEVLMRGVRVRMHRLGDEYLIKRSITYLQSLEREFATYLRQAAEEGRLMADLDADLPEGDHQP